jgi:hypothetical protein
MIINIVKEYLKLSKLNQVEPVLCENEEHGTLYANLDKNDKVFLYCLACKYKIKLGIDSLEDIIKSVIIINNLS